MNYRVLLIHNRPRKADDGNVSEHEADSIISELLGEHSDFSFVDAASEGDLLLTYGPTRIKDLSNATDLAVGVWFGEYDDAEADEEFFLNLGFWAARKGNKTLLLVSHGDYKKAQVSDAFEDLVSKNPNATFAYKNASQVVLALKDMTQHAEADQQSRRSQLEDIRNNLPISKSWEHLEFMRCGYKNGQVPCDLKLPAMEFAAIMSQKADVITQHAKFCNDLEQINESANQARTLMVHGRKLYSNLLKTNLIQLSAKASELESAFDDSMEDLESSLKEHLESVDYQDLADMFARLRKVLEFLRTIEGRLITEGLECEGQELYAHHPGSFDDEIARQLIQLDSCNERIEEICSTFYRVNLARDVGGFREIHRGGIVSLFQSVCDDLKSNTRGGTRYE